MASKSDLELREDVENDKDLLDDWVIISDIEAATEDNLQTDNVQEVETEEDAGAKVETAEPQPDSAQEVDNQNNAGANVENAVPQAAAIYLDNDLLLERLLQEIGREIYTLFSVIMVIAIIAMAGRDVTIRLMEAADVKHIQIYGFALLLILCSCIMGRPFGAFAAGLEFHDDVSSDDSSSSNEEEREDSDVHNEEEREDSDVHNEEEKEESGVRNEEEQPEEKEMQDRAHRSYEAHNFEVWEYIVIFIVLYFALYMNLSGRLYQDTKVYTIQ